MSRSDALPALKAPGPEFDSQYQKRNTSKKKKKKKKKKFPLHTYRSGSKLLKVSFLPKHYLSVPISVMILENRSLSLPLMIRSQPCSVSSAPFGPHLTTHSLSSQSHWGLDYKYEFGEGQVRLLTYTFSWFSAPVIIVSIANDCYFSTSIARSFFLFIGVIMTSGTILIRNSKNSIFIFKILISSPIS